MAREARTACVSDRRRRETAVEGREGRAREVYRQPLFQPNEVDSDPCRSRRVTPTAGTSVGLDVSPREPCHA
jgi:hypothetical protein